MSNNKSLHLYRSLWSIDATRHLSTTLSWFRSTSICTMLTSSPKFLHWGGHFIHNDSSDPLVWRQILLQIKLVYSYTNQSNQSPLIRQWHKPDFSVQDGQKRSTAYEISVVPKAIIDQSLPPHCDVKIIDTSIQLHCNKQFLRQMVFKIQLHNNISYAPHIPLVTAEVNGSQFTRFSF